MSMYWFGQNIETERPWEDDASWKDLLARRQRLGRTPLTTIIDVLDDFSRAWTEGSPLFKEALPRLVAESGFAPEEVEKTLALLKGLLSRESLEKRVRAEFHPAEMLDKFVKTPGFSGKTKAMPLGVLLHVTAGNVFLSSIDSLIMGLLTKNLSILKVSSQNTFFPLFFARKLAEADQQKVLADKFAVLHWKGGDRQMEDLMKKKVNGIIAWGGEEMIESYRTGLSPQVKLLDFGPKISIQAVTNEGLRGKDLKLLAEKIAADIVPWDQGACASPQNLFLQEGANEKALLEAIDGALGASPRGGQVSPDEAVEILKEHQRALYSELMEGGAAVKGKGHLLHLERSMILRPSPLHRSLIIKRFKDEHDLSTSLAPFAYYLQSCSYLFSAKEKETYLEALAEAGIKRMAPLGTITWGMEGAPHDGRNVLRELTSLAVDELRTAGLGEEKGAPRSSAELKAHFESAKHPPGYIFSSGGTTGEPKFLHFSYEEFDFVTDMLAHNLRAQGISAGMTVANLFVAGNLWSSFMAVEKALEKIGAVQLPIGGLCSTENIVLYLKRFRPDVIMGIPSLLINYAEHAESKGESLSVPKVFYAGEALSAARREFLAKSWGTVYFGSAGYASVDAGMIAYQCAECGPGEHHLFSDLVEMQIINEEAVITSLYRDTMPIENYRTGDRAEWIGPCSCGRPEPRLRLLGRIDNVIQIWSCRVRLDDIERSIKEIAPQIKTFQVLIEEEVRGDGVKERMKLLVETEKSGLPRLAETIYDNSRDLKDTIGLDRFLDCFSVETTDAVARNARTGKISLVIDRRR